ncbi:hypothetical protein EMEDMD4_460007 [Sinorhizobium medicae]|uniref:Uncharacterized protein n=1 Tax=Sinorhizobium medicae TaxID=110321 RepID=A0A508WZH4_9HYPH|nr:hypothetical protein EMEDMD4_460007 [Sinorhizobium medicae]
MAGWLALAVWFAEMRRANLVPSGIHDRVTDAGGARADHADLRGGGLGEVDHPAANERAAIIDPDDDGLAVAFIGDLNLGAELQFAVCGGQVRGVHSFAGSRFRGKRVPGCPAATGACGLTIGGRDKPDPGGE